ncbi:MAG: hypothetical protein M1830_007327 [Pleopsidium flavum]|nr:MAG: hypothetical protein M1830_007327 [Pleopsidium flavum]
MESTASTASERKKRPPNLIFSEDLRSPASAVLVPLEMAFSPSEPRLHPDGTTSPNITSSPSAVSRANIRHQNQNTPIPPPPRSPSPANTTPHHLKPLLTFTDSTNSLHILQELPVPKNSQSALNSHSNSLLPESRIIMPPSTTHEDAELIQLPKSETWFPPRDFKFLPPETDQQPQQRDLAGGRMVTER